MKRDFERVLDECLSQLNTGLDPDRVDIEAVLARHPEHAADLRPLLQVAMAVRQTPQPTPSPAAKVAGRRLLLSAVARKRREMAARPGLLRRLEEAVSILLEPLLRPGNLRLARVAVTLSLVIVLASFGTMKVAANSLPDSPLYHVKLVTERVQLVLTPAASSKARLHMSYAERRLSETEALLAAGKGLHGATLEALQRENQRALAAIGRSPDEERPTLLTRFTALAERQQEALEQVRLRVPPSEQGVVEEAISAAEESGRIATAAVEEPDLLLTPSPTASPTATETATLVPPTATPVPKPTATPVPPTATPVPTAATTPVPPTPTPTPEIVLTPIEPTKEPAATPTPEVVVPPFSTPEEPLVTPTPEEPTATPVPPTATPEPTATSEPQVGIPFQPDTAP